MNPLQKIKSYFTRPVIVQQKAGSGISASYAFPTTGGYGSGSKYAGGMSASKLVVMHDHFKIRQHVRDAMYDSIEARTIVERYADTVVDVGLKLKPTPIAELIGLSPEDAEVWAETVAQRFHLWASSKKSHRTRVNNFYQNQHLYERFQQRDNDVFVRMYYGREWDTISPLQIDFVDPNQIKGYAYTSTYAQIGGDDGIIRDSAGRETGYKIWNFDQQSGKYTETVIPAIGEKSGRVFMLHGFSPEYAGQGRGYSRLAHAVQDFEKLTDFKAATVTKAISQASLVMAVENDAMDPSNPMAGRVAGPIREYGSYPDPATDAQNVTATSLEPVINYTAMPEATLTQPGTGIFNLRRGDKIKNLQDTSPSAQYDVFVNAFCSFLAASVGMSVELLLMKFNANYSASRATLILFWRIAMMWREEMAADFLNPVYEMWLAEEIAAGRVTAPGWSDPLIRSAWLCCEWAGSPMPSIDPLKSMQASKMAAELGAETLDDIAREYNGSSGKANRMKLKRQFEELPEPTWGWKDKPQEGNPAQNGGNKEDE